MSKLRFKKMRLWLAYPVFIIYPFVARMTDFSFWAGAFLILVGIVIRFWASGYIRKSRQLATAGPYAHMRNPLYLGNFIIGFGVMVIANNFWLVFYYAVAFFIMYRGTILEEQVSLAGKFGADYREYCAGVPMFFPSIKEYKKAQKEPFSLRQSFKNGEFIRLFGFLLVILFFYLWLTLGIKREAFGPKVLCVLLLFIVFLSLLWFNIYIRRKAAKRGEMA